MKQIVRIDFYQYEQRKKAALVNCLSGFKSANMVGTYSSDKKSNLSIVSSCFHIGASPALMGLIIRPSTTERDRHSLENILETGVCTLNHVSLEIIEKAHQTSARYPRGISEFDEVGLTECFRENFLAPYVAESPVQIGLSLREHQHLSINGCELLILEIQHLYTCEEWIMNDGFLDIEAAGTTALSGLDSYHKSLRISRLSYAKTEHWPTSISLNGI